jgi:hypothetical protein
MKRNIIAVLATPDATINSALLRIEQQAQYDAVGRKVERTMAAVVAHCAGDPEEGHVQACLSKLEEQGIRYSAEDHDRRIIIRVTGLPRTEYFPAKNRWRAAGESKRHHGTVEQLIAWIKETVR